MLGAVLCPAAWLPAPCLLRMTPLACTCHPTIVIIKIVSKKKNCIQTLPNSHRGGTHFCGEPLSCPEQQGWERKRKKGKQVHSSHPWGTQRKGLGVDHSPSLWPHPQLLSAAHSLCPRGGWGSFLGSMSRIQAPDESESLVTPYFVGLHC